MALFRAVFQIVIKNPTGNLWWLTQCFDVDPVTNEQPFFANYIPLEFNALVFYFQYFGDLFVA